MKYEVLSVQSTIMSNSRYM